MPQIVYQVGWQGTGHDTLYPSYVLCLRLVPFPRLVRNDCSLYLECSSISDLALCRLNIVNQQLGGTPALQQLAAEAQAQYGAAISYHINVDDAYANYSSVPNPEWNTSYMCWDTDAELFIW